jgi:hypothetical protein
MNHRSTGAGFVSIHSIIIWVGHITIIATKSPLNVVINMPSGKRLQFANCKIIYK